MQMFISKALILTALSDDIVEDGDGTEWHTMAGLARDVRLGEPRIQHAAIRRAVRSMEQAGYVEVKRGCAVVSARTGRQIGHAQNLVRLTERGHEYFRARYERDE
jgi:hypothetical protein